MEDVGQGTVVDMRPEHVERGDHVRGYAGAPCDVGRPAGTCVRRDVQHDRAPLEELHRLVTIVRHLTEGLSGAVGIIAHDRRLDERHLAGKAGLCQRLMDADILDTVLGEVGHSAEGEDGDGHG